MTDYARPADLDTALSLMAGGDRLILGGGTDLYPVAGRRIEGKVLDITGLAALRGIRRDGGLYIGAATTWSEIANAMLPPSMAGLQAAARLVGGPQVQNTGTIGGNICNASPAADGVPPLLALDAEVELASRRGGRSMRLEEFIEGPRKTARACDEIVVALRIPEKSLKGKSAFIKLGARSHLVISIAMVACRLVTNGVTVTDIALAVGACSAVARRLPRVEAALIGAPLDHLSERILAEDVNATLAPIDDVRATAAYRREAATDLVRRVVQEVAP